jgi:flagellar M-ring protein FliF
LVAGSTSDIPKENVEVVDQNMNLLSEGIFDKDKQNTAPNNINLDESKAAENKLDGQLKKSILDILEPMFGAGKVKVTVNTDLNFDTTETTQIKIDPEKVIKKETRSENTSTNNSNGGSLVDNNMSNTANNGAGKNQSKEETIEYEVGKTETNIISAPGEVRRITASVAIDGNLGPGVMRDVEDLVSNSIGMNKDRGDSISAVSR